MIRVDKRVGIQEEKGEKFHKIHWNSMNAHCGSKTNLTLKVHQAEEKGFEKCEKCFES